MLKPLVLHLKRQWWEDIRAGSKQEEYRRRTPYWIRRLRGKQFSEVVLLLGYPKAGDESRTLRRPWKGFTEKTIVHPHFGGQAEVFSIDVSPNSDLTSHSSAYMVVGGLSMVMIKT